MERARFSQPAAPMREGTWNDVVIELTGELTKTSAAHEHLFEREKVIISALKSMIQ